METNIQVFTSTEFGELGILQEGDKFWFPASECAVKLGYSTPRDAVKRHCPHVVKRDMGVQTGVKSDGSAAEQTVGKNFIPEGDLYRLIIRSKLDSAQRFESWVFDEVLPSIRRHGAYVMPELLEELQRNTEKNAKLLADLAAEQRSRIRLEETNRALEAEKKSLLSAVEEAKPKVSYYDLILQNPAAVPVTLIAKDYGYSAVRFNALLHEFGIQYSVGGTWELYQDYADRGYTHGNVYMTKEGHTKMHTCWTQKGRLFLYGFLKASGIVPKVEVTA